MVRPEQFNFLFFEQEKNKTKTKCDTLIKNVPYSTTLDTLHVPLPKSNLTELSRGSYS